MWHIAMRPGKRRALDKASEIDALADKSEKLKAGVRAKVEHSVRVIKHQFRHMKVRYRGLKKNTVQWIALSNLWMVRGKFMVAKG
jgi:IS5 family transposase